MSIKGVRYKNGSWEANCMIDGTRLYKRFSSKKLASLWIADRKLKSERREIGLAVKVDLEEFLEEFLEYFRDHASRGGHERMLLSQRYLKEHLKGITRLDRVSPEVIERYKRGPERRRSQRTRLTGSFVT